MVLLREGKLFPDVITERKQQQQQQKQDNGFTLKKQQQQHQQHQSEKGIKQPETTMTGHVGACKNGRKARPNQRETSELKETSVLARPFIPNNLDQWTKPTYVHRCQAFGRLDTSTILKSIVPRFAESQDGCACDLKHRYEATGGDRQQVHFLHRPQFANMSQADFGAVSMIDDSCTVQDYVCSLEKLVALEHIEIVGSYQQYFQHNVQIFPTRRRAGQRTNGSSASTAPTTAYCVIPGLADARPSPHTGDIVHIRPMRLISLPLPPLYPNDYATRWSPPQHVVELVGRITTVERNGKVTFTWIDDHFAGILAQCFPEQTFLVSFEPSTTPLDRVLDGLEWLTSCTKDSDGRAGSVMQRLLFPTGAPLVPPALSTYRRPEYQDLNDQQKKFVDMVVRRTDHPCLEDDAIRPPIVLTGPAGTGKTLALLEGILHTLRTDPDARILVCTPAHTASDVVTRRLAESLSSDELFRLYDVDKLVESVPIELLPYTYQTSSTGQFDLPPNLLQYRVIVCTCSDSAILVQAGVTNQEMRQRRECFRTSLGRMLPGCHLEGNVSGTHKPHFTHLFIDEAAQATEAETILCLSVVADTIPPTSSTEGKVRKVEIALVGDPRQLSPSVYSAAAAKAGLGRSWLERLLQTPVQCLGGGNPDMLGPERYRDDSPLTYWMQEQLSIFVTQNYRGHESFLMMPSTLFYFDKLQCASSLMDAEFWSSRAQQLAGRFLTPVVPPGVLDGVLANGNGEVPQSLQVMTKKDWPIVFVGVQGRDVSLSIESFASSSSWQNEEEANTVVQCASGLVSDGVEKSQIGVMAPFRGQVVLIRQLLRKANLDEINVGTIEDYQAVEHDVIILSLTRSNANFVPSDMERRMGVFGQEKRTNVALTRAENLMIVIGNPDTMWATDTVWKQWLLFCYRNGLWYGEPGKLKENLKRLAENGPVRIVSHRVRPSHLMNGCEASQECRHASQEDGTIIVGTMELRRRMAV